MEPRDLNRMFDALAPTPDQEQAVLDRLLQTERKGRPIRKLKKLTVVAIAAALMVISCAAAVVMGLDQRLIDYFGAGPEQAELLAPGAVPVDVTVKDNGAEFHVSQVLMDQHFLLVLAEFTAPEGVTLDNKGDPFLLFGDFTLDFLNADREPYAEDDLSGWAFTIRCLDDEDPADNHMTALLELRLDSGVDCQKAAFFRLSFTDFGWFDTDILEFVSLRSGTWSCDIPLPQTEIGQTHEVNIPVGEIDGVNISMKSYYLSPMTLQITLEREIPIDFYGDDEAVRHRWQSAVGGTERVSLTSRDGMKIPLRGKGGGSGLQEQEQLYRLEEITALSQLQGGTLNIRIEDGSVDIPLDGLVPVG